MLVSDHALKINIIPENLYLFLEFMILGDKWIGILLWGYLW